MPFYDLRCENCGEEFNIRASVAEKEERRIACPACGAQELASVYKSAPAYIKSTKEAVCPNSHVCGAGCCHAHGGH